MRSLNCRYHLHRIHNIIAYGGRFSWVDDKLFLSLYIYIYITTVEDVPTPVLSTVNKYQYPIAFEVFSTRQKSIGVDRKLRVFQSIDRIALHSAASTARLVTYHWWPTAVVVELCLLAYYYYFFPQILTMLPYAPVLQHFPPNSHNVFISQFQLLHFPPDCYSKPPGKRRSQ